MSQQPTSDTTVSACAETFLSFPSLSLSLSLFIVLAADAGEFVSAAAAAGDHRRASMSLSVCVCVCSSEASRPVDENTAALKTPASSRS